MIALLVVGLATALLAMALRRSALARRLVDVPNERSLHVSPTPRVGGLALMACALPLAAWHADTPVGVLVGAAAVLSLVSARDDLRSLPIEVRLPIHLLAAGIAVWAISTRAGNVPAAGWAELLLAALAIAWMTNLFNFMDGADGFAGGMACIGFAALAVAAATTPGAAPLAWCAAALAAASAGFLTQNFPPARVFMGDAGSVPLGFLAGALGYAGIARDAWPPWLPLLVFSPFLVDATVTLLRRALRGERVWRAHREHAYQRLVLAGWSKRRLALTSYALMAAAAGSALALRGSNAMLQCAIITAWIVGYVVLLLAVERRCAAPQAPPGGFGP